MRVRIIAVGRLKDPPALALVERYVARCGWPIEMVEVQPRAPLVGDRLLKAEADLLLAAVPTGARVVALDEKGRQVASAALAERLQGWADEGRRDTAFLIGGPDGLDERVRARADLVLAFGLQTWPHDLVRVLLAEQLYRCWTILTNHPYHRS